MKKHFITLVFALVSSFAFCADIKVIEVSIQKFREIRKDLEKKKIAYFLDSGPIHGESFGKTPKEIVTYKTLDENGLEMKLTTGSRP